MHFCAIFTKAESNALGTLFGPDVGSFTGVKPLVNSNMRESGATFHPVLAFSGLLVLVYVYLLERSKSHFNL